MHSKSFQLKAPLDTFAVPLEMFLSDVAINSIRSYSGEYVGDGKTSKSITVPFYPSIIIISPKINLTTSASTITGEMVFSLIKNIGASWVPSVGFIKNGVTSAGNNSFTIGDNSAVNTAGASYVYFVVG